MSFGTRLRIAGVVVGISGCVSSMYSEPRGTTYARYAGPVLVKFTNASPDRMCGLYISDDGEDDYGDNWLPAAGVPSGGSIDFRVKPGKYKARWDTCREGALRPYYAATLWREAAFTVKRETQLYAYVADAVAPTKRAAVMGRDYQVVRFPGQAIDPNPRPAPRHPQPQQVALRASNEPPVIAGFIGRVPLSAEMVAAREPEPPIEKFDAREFVDTRVKLAAPPPAPGKKKPAGPRPSLTRKHDLADSAIQYRKR